MINARACMLLHAYICVHMHAFFPWQTHFSSMIQFLSVCIHIDHMIAIASRCRRRQLASLCTFDAGNVRDSIISTVEGLDRHSGAAAACMQHAPDRPRRSTAPASHILIGPYGCARSTSRLTPRVSSASCSMPWSKRGRRGRGLGGRSTWMSLQRCYLTSVNHLNYIRVGTAWGREYYI